MLISKPERWFPTRQCAMDQFHLAQGQGDLPIELWAEPNGTSLHPCWQSYLCRYADWLAQPHTSFLSATRWRCHIWYQLDWLKIQITTKERVRITLGYADGTPVNFGLF